MHDGQMLFQSTVTKDQDEWSVDTILQSLIEDDRIRDTIVVGIFNHDHLRALEYLPQRPLQSMSTEEVHTLSTHPDPQLPELPKGPFLADRYLQFLVTELKPFIDHTYATDPSHNYLCGSSMGGLISWYGLCEYPAVFSGAACLSTHWPGLFRLEQNPLPARWIHYLESHLPAPGQHRFYFDHGTEDLDNLYGPTQKEADRLAAAKGYTDKLWTSRIYPGTGHAESDWRERLHIPLTWLLGRS